MPAGSDIEPAFSAQVAVDEAPPAPDNGSTQDADVAALPRTGGLFDDVPPPVAPAPVDPAAPRDEHRA